MRMRGTKERGINPKAARFRLRVGRSRLHRYGVFALVDIPSGRQVIEYTGKRLSVLQALKIWPPNDIYIVGVNSRRCLDGGAGGSGAQFINHSCRPNLIWRCLRSRLYFYSCRKIRAGEELTVKYRYHVKMKRIRCRCGARGCRGTVRYILS
jgi:SET domain-containing protein